MRHADRACNDKSTTHTQKSYYHTEKACLCEMKETAPAYILSSVPLTHIRMACEIEFVFI